MELIHKKKKDPSISTQRYVDVDSVKDDVIVLKNGSLRAVLMVSSINFDLKSTEEQDAIIARYQGFLNSLDFSVQIIINSRRFDVEPYLEMLRQKEMLQENELLKMQTAEYHDFIKSLVDVSQIMSKVFYIIVPFYPTENKKGGFWEKISNAIAPKQQAVQSREIFETYKNQLWQRVEQVQAAMSGTGIRMAILKTDELIELLYNSYNPSLERYSNLKDVNKLDFKI